MSGWSSLGSCWLCDCQACSCQPVHHRSPHAFLIIVMRRHSENVLCPNHYMKEAKRWARGNCDKCPEEHDMKSPDPLTTQHRAPTPL
eukprot:6488969-Amphidinium_carterae.2